MSIRSGARSESYGTDSEADGITPAAYPKSSNWRRRRECRTGLRSAACRYAESFCKGAIGRLRSAVAGHSEREASPYAGYDTPNEPPCAKASLVPPK